MARRQDAPIEDPVVPPGPSTIDLHAHTIRSDGVLEPAALVAAAAACGVRLFAITDHDDLSAYRELTGPGAPPIPAGLTLLPGVEINCLTTGLSGLWEGEVHVLGLGVDPADAVFEDVLDGQRSERRVRFTRTLERLRKLGLALDEAASSVDLTVTSSLGRPTIARLLVAAGHASSVEDAFARFLARGRPGYVPRHGIGPRAAITAIRSAGGLAALAHYGEAARRRSVVRGLRGLGLGGLEVYYRTFDRSTVEAVGRVAAEFGLVSTGGSDYHGDTGAYRESHAALWVPPEVGPGLMAAIGFAGLGSTSQSGQRGATRTPADECLADGGLAVGESGGGSTTMNGRDG